MDIWIYVWTDGEIKHWQWLSRWWLTPHCPRPVSPATTQGHLCCHADKQQIEPIHTTLLCRLCVWVHAVRSSLVFKETPDRHRVPVDRRSIQPVMRTAVRPSKRHGRWTNDLGVDLGGCFQDENSATPWQPATACRLYLHHWVRRSVLAVLFYFWFVSSVSSAILLQLLRHIAFTSLYWLTGAPFIGSCHLIKT